MNSGRRVVAAVAVALVAAMTALGADLWSSRDHEARITSDEEAVAAAARLLQGDLDEPRVARVELVEEAHEFPAVVPDLGFGTFGRRGFRPAWVVIVRGKFHCKGRVSYVRLPFLFEAETGQPLTHGAVTCGVFAHPNVAPSNG